MARAFREGHWARALESVFPPLHPLLAAAVPLPFSSGAAVWRALQLEALACDLAALWLVVALAGRLLSQRAALLAGLWYALGLLPAWTVADGMSGPLFRLCVAAALSGWCGRSMALTGLAAGLAAATRPEGLALAPLALAAGRRRRGWSGALAALVLALGPRALYLGARAAASGRFTLWPKGELMAGLSASSEQDLAAALAHYARETGEFLLQGFDGLGYLPYVLLPWGLWIVLNRRGALRLPLGLALGALACVPFFFANRRFWTPWLPVLLPVCAAGGAALLERRRRIGWALVGLLLLPQAVRLPRARRRALAVLQPLAARIGAEPFAADLPRLFLFTGRRPPPPLRIERRALTAQAADPATRWAVSLARRRSFDPRAMRALGYRRVEPLSLGLPQGRARDRLEIWHRP